jgi:hypothetical protein
VTSTYLKYRDINFSSARQALLDKVIPIIDGYEKAGYVMSLRQVYYQLVAKRIIPNNDAEYGKLGDLVSDGRMAGLISWTAIEDRGRNLMGLKTQISPKEAVKATRDDYRRDLWENQLCRPEFWVEKQALEGVIGSIANKHRVDYYATRGYNSQTMAWEAGQRFAARIQHGQRPVVLYLGDHDPSGIDMTRDVEERIELFCGAPVQVVRLALNMDQVRQVNPPPNPAKMTDSRTADYVTRYGEYSWELDALSPDYLDRIMSEAVDAFRDAKLWDAAVGREAKDIDELDNVVEGL